MTGEEIRNKNNWECYGQPFENPIQVEIAAQLADINATLNKNTIPILVEETAKNIVATTNEEYNLAQARSMVKLVITNAVRP